MRKFIFFLILTFFKTILISQSHTFSGFVEDSNSGERLIFANIYDKESGNGTISNEYGFFSLKTNKMPITVTFSYIGYTTQEHTFKTKVDTNLIVKLAPSLEIEEVKVVADNPIKIAQTGRVSIPVKSIEKLPVVFGESDILKTIQLMPGVQGGVDGFSGIYVRGGSADQNLILLDGTPVYNINHLFGMFSVFNTDAIKSATLYKSGFPARYGGRISSVLDIRMKEGNMNKWQGNASIGLVSSKILVEGPIRPGKTSMLFTIRRSYVDLFTSLYFLFAEPGFNMGYNFNDWNLKINHKINPNNRIYVSSYFGKDNYFQNEKLENNISYFESKKKNAWGNHTLTTRWNHLYNNDVFGNLTFSYSRYRFYFRDYLFEKGIDEESGEEFENLLESSVKDMSLNYDLDFQVNDRNRVKCGFQYSHQIFRPNVSGDFSLGVETKSKLSPSFGNRNHYVNYTALYLEDEWELLDRFLINSGIRNTLFFVEDRFANYIEPRLTANFKISSMSSLKISYCKASQFLHLLTSTGAGFPTDLWVPSTKTVKPALANIYSVNFSRKLGNYFLADVEAYYKTLRNITEYKDIVYSFSNNTWEGLVEQGTGNAKGLDVSLTKANGKLTGWIGYGYLDSDREFPEINNGKSFPFKYARKHTFNIVLNYKFTERFELGAVWAGYSGYYITLPESYYKSFQSHGDFNDERFRNPNSGFLYYLPGRNNYLTPPYHRLDLNAKFTKAKKKTTRSWSFGVYNAYGNPNPTFIVDKGDQIEIYSYLVFFPFASYDVKF